MLPEKELRRMRPGWETKRPCRSKKDQKKCVSSKKVFNRFNILGIVG